MNIPWTLYTGSGAWNPLLWLIAFAVACGVAWYIRSFGRKDFREGLQAEPFISGNEEPEDGGGHIPASNLYWGFLESLKGYYNRIISGNIQRQQGEKAPGIAQVVGAPHIIGHKGENFPLQQL